MLGLAIHFDQLGLEVKAHLLEYDFESLDGVCVKHLSSILCDEDKMNVQSKDTMSTVTDTAWQ
jgi:hypothetical protein